jgi:hypothetical protein
MLSETLADCSAPDAATELLAASPPTGSGEHTAPITPVSPYHAARWARDRHVEELENRIRYLRALVFILLGVSAIASRAPSRWHGSRGSCPTWSRWTGSGSRERSGAWRTCPFPKSA